MNRRAYGQLLVSRFREFRREPEVVFWVFVFPLLLALGLGIAYREKPQDKTFVAVIEQSGAPQVLLTLSANPEIHAEVVPLATATQQLRLGRVAIVVAPGESIQYWLDPSRPDSLLARTIVDDTLQRAAGRKNPIGTSIRNFSEPGSRYIDFLIPGLLGMNLMSGGMWGIGFVIVEMRNKKLLKRLIATPMLKSDFLLSAMTSRLILMLMEVALLLLFGWLVFKMAILGSIAAIVIVGLFGAVSFAGLGLLVASRAQKIETVSGLMNLVMLPMFVLSGVFFSSERFPQALQPIIKALPLTALNDAFRAVILEGASLQSQVVRLAILAAWGGISFALALRWFRWS